MSNILNLKTINLLSELPDYNNIVPVNPRSIAAVSSLVVADGNIIVQLSGRVCARYRVASVRVLPEKAMARSENIKGLEIEALITLEPHCCAARSDISVVDGLSEEVFVDGVRAVSEIQVVAHKISIPLSGNVFARSSDISAYVGSNVIIIDTIIIGTETPPKKAEDINIDGVRAISSEIDIVANTTIIPLSGSVAARANIKGIGHKTTVLLSGNIFARSVDISAFVKDPVSLIIDAPSAMIYYKMLESFGGVWIDEEPFVLNHNLLYAFNEFDFPKTVPAAIIYNCILTGAQNGVEDLILPLKNFQTRLRDGEPTYCGIVVPDVEKYLSAVLERKNGEIVIKRGILYNSGEKNFVELVRVNLEEIGYDRGTKNNSISLSGHKTTQNISPKTVELKKIQTESFQKDGSYRIRSDVDFFTRPGDTVVWHGKSMVAGMITITVGSRTSSMEITGA